MAVSKSMRKKMEQRSKDLAKRGGGKLPFFTIKEGTTRMRTLPVPPDEEFAVEASYVFINKDLGGFISPTTIGKKCAWTAKYEELKASKKPNDKKLADRMYPKVRFFSPHIRYTDDAGKEVDEAAGVKLLLLTNKQYQAMIDYYLDNDYGDFTDPMEGYDLKFKRTGTGKMDTEYSVRNCKTSRLPKKYRQTYDIMEMMKPHIPSYEDTKELVKAFLKLDFDDEDDNQQKETVKKKKKVRSDV